MGTQQLESYLLSPIADHKEKYDLGGVEIKIVKNFENNLRRRNCQLGIVEVLSPTNPLQLTVGDIVFVNHFTFQGDIGLDKSFTWQDHTVYEGKMLFKVPINKIFFKYNEGDIEALGDVVVVRGVYEEEHKFGLYLGEKQFKDRGEIIYASDSTLVGKTILVYPNALYPLELKDLDYYKILNEEIVGFIEGEEVFPTKDRALIEVMEKKEDSGLDLSLMKRDRFGKGKVIRTGELSCRHKNWIGEGDVVVLNTEQGVKFNDQVVVDLDYSTVYCREDLKV